MHQVLLFLVCLARPAGKACLICLAGFAISSLAYSSQTCRFCQDMAMPPRLWLHRVNRDIASSSHRSGLYQEGQTHSPAAAG